MFRFFDLCLSLAGLIVLFPVLLALTVLGYFFSGSPIFIQTRVGKDLKPFKLIKFRTMKVGTADLASHLVGSSEITPYGAFLRRTKLDELPQLINVLFGSMSLVGPRPCLQNQTQLIDERRKNCVFDVRPGVTGIAQINNIDMSTPERLAEVDSKMIGNYSIGLYFRCILHTAIGKGVGDAAKAVKGDDK